MTPIHFIGGEKGGVGKSLVARVLAQYCIDHDRAFLGFDTDRSHNTLMRFYADYTSPVVVDRYESLDRIVEAAVEEPGRTILVDLAAQTQAPLTRWMDESGVLELAEESDIGLRYWHVMDSGRDSVDLLAKLLDRYAGRLDLVLVQNELRGDDFGLLEASGLLERTREAGAKRITIKRLHEATMVKIDGLDSSFWAAAQGTALGLLERQRVKLWLKSAYAELDTLGL